jgi:trk system potassium uptake protein TrkH
MMRRLSPPQIIVLSFTGLVLSGTALLCLPGMVVGPPLPLIDVLFTATSAVCVTGLVVVDTGSRFSPLGQAIILLLIQAGGLGIMTFSVVFALMRGRRLGFREKLLISDTFASLPGANARRLVKNIFRFTLACELVGAAVLFACWLPGRGVAETAWLALFHAVSAFCNAGFSLFADSLMGYRTHPVVNLVVMALIIAGGIGFLVMTEGWYRLRHPALRRPWSLHTKLVATVSAVLIVVGTLGLWCCERLSGQFTGGITGGLPAALFQAVSARTAGFNTIDIGALSDASLLLIIFMMFIGASPGSCAGGIKTTTFGILMLAAWARFSGREAVGGFRRTVPPSTVNQAFTIFIVSLVVLLCFIFALSLSDADVVPSLLASRARFMELMFEAVSAFGTVGLSTGITPTLSFTGKLLLVFLMFIGRVGPLTALVFLTGTRRRGGQYAYVEEQVMIG